MNARMFWHAAVVATALIMSREAQAQSQFKIEGEIHDFTGPMTPADPLGPRQIDNEWSLTLNTANGKVGFMASLNMIRSDNVTRSAHTHHVRITDAQVTPITNGYRVSGPATITSNGAAAGFSGSPVDFEITGGGAVPFATVKLKFGGGAIGHFGEASLGGVVSLGK